MHHADANAFGRQGICMNSLASQKAHYSAVRQRLFRPQNAVEERKGKEATQVAKTTKKPLDNVLEFIRERCLHYRVRMDDIQGRPITRDIVHCRSIIMAEVRDSFDITIEAICAYFGGRNHSTVVKSIARGRYLLSPKGQEEFKAERERLEAIRMDYLAGLSYDVLRERHHVDSKTVGAFIIRYRWPVRTVVERL